MIFPRPPLAVFLLCAATLAPVAAVAAKSHPTRPATIPDANAYKGAVIMDAATGQVLFEDHDGESSPPASMTKLMTFLVIHDKLQSGALTLQTPVTVTAADSKIGGTQVWLKEKEVFPVEEMLYAMMIQSANDAAFALARTAAGSVPAFVELMNAKARELGMTHTTFRSPHGLPPASRHLADGDLTTPLDFALLSRHLLLTTDVLKYTSVRTRKFGENVRPFDRVIVMTNHDHLLGHVDGVDGLKTGFTNGAGFCLSATALRNGKRIIVVVMGSQDSKTRDVKVAELIERGFAALPLTGPAFTPQTGPAPEVSPISAAPLPQPAASPDIKFALPPPKK
jgi:D-alanyl-D-alanine carboxypeptidase